MIAVSISSPSAWAQRDRRRHHRLSRHRRARRRAHKGEGLGNQFLSNIRETDAILHVVRCHGDDNVIHSEGSVDPLRDIETIETELIYSDLEQAEKRLERVERAARGGDKAAVAEKAWLEELIEGYNAGRPARFTPMPDEVDKGQTVQPLTAKPCCSSPTWMRAARRSPRPSSPHAKAQEAGAVAISSRIEAELSELDDEEAAMMRADLGVAESGLERIVTGAFSLLNLLTFFTVGSGVRAQSWHLRQGLTVWHAAGEIHGDIQKGFVRAEVVNWEQLLEAGGYSQARDKGTLRIEGRDYLMQDGDVITVKHTN